MFEFFALSLKSLEHFVQTLLDVSLNDVDLMLT